MLDAFEVLGPSGAAPAIFKGGVVSGASYSGNPVTPGQIVSIFGSNFLGTGQAQSTAVPLATQLGASNTSVTACGVNIPLFVVVPGQINAQVPWECPTTGTVQMTVTSNGQTSAPQTVTFAAASPGLFTQGASSTGNGAILHANNSLVTPGQPGAGGRNRGCLLHRSGPDQPRIRDRNGGHRRQPNRESRDGVHRRPTGERGV
jgi:hypothetical protein